MAPVVLDRDALREVWRNAVVVYLLHALHGGVLFSKQSKHRLQALFSRQGQRRWVIHIDLIKSKTHFLQYAARYVRRPPIAEHRFTEISNQDIVFWTKDLRLKRRVRTRYSTADFIAALADHVPDRYRHAVRYFGLLASRSKRQTFAALFAVLGQSIRGRPRRLTWAESIAKYFGKDPLIDRAGTVMRYVGRQAPLLTH